MEDFSIRAIVIGVSLFVTMLTLSAVIIYYNTAKGAADIVSNRVDIASNFDNIMRSDKFEDNLSGIEIRSLIRKYANNEDVRISIRKISGEETDAYENINNSKKWVSKETNLINEYMLDMIEPSWSNHVGKVEKYNLVFLNIELNVDK